MSRSTILTSMDEAGLTIGSMTIGKEYSINHIGCPAGPDSKQRLYLNKREGILAWYCHNEGDGGVLDLGAGDRIRGMLTDGDAIATHDKIREIGPLWTPREVYNVLPSTHAAVKFMEKYLGPNWYGIAQEAGIMYSCMDDGWAYPKGEGWQVRYMYPTNPKRKSTSYGNTKDAPLKMVSGRRRPTRRDGGTGPKHYVFTEDYISATCISKHLYCIGVPLFGVHTTLRQLAMFLKTTPDNARYIVWLDNDSDLVRAKAWGIGQDLSLLCTGARKWVVWDGDTEPKKLSPDVRSKILVDLIKGLDCAT